MQVFRKRLLGIDALVVSESGGQVAIRDARGGIRTWKLSGSEASQGTSTQLLDLRNPLTAAADSGTVTVWTDGTKLALHHAGSARNANQPLRRRTGSRLRSVYIADEGNRVATIDSQSLISFFSAGRQTAQTRLAAATTAAFGSAGRTLVVGTEQGEVVSLDAETGQILHREKGHTGSVTMIVNMANQRRYATSGTDRALRFWDTQTGQAIEQPLVILPQAANGGDYHPRSQSLAIGCNTTLVCYRCTDQVQEIASAAIPLVAQHVVFLRNGKRILLARDRELKIVNAEDARVLYSFPNVNASIRCIKSNLDDPTLLLSDGSLRSWRVR
ncbi:WD40 repeat domain-containing protein [Roseimaritima ulvae]|uniref:Serine-threonine kinase receptor-associated protein n=1 Tax=Roseimaritima ulvae TaxID=980254 RepID=A0A5B9QNM4_9BACT|nr:PQQ-binding-like beta-propeller repeat protein [Roseimaritima ulvae]QEG39260.1 hypothetical protein UC8_12210 [Roseimaritima ulvae]